MIDFRETILKWSALPDGNEFLETNSLLEHLGDNLFYDYEPNVGIQGDYYTRLQKWIFNCQDELDQQNLLRIAKKIFYVGREEIRSLYKSAFSINIINWIIKNEQISVTDLKLNEKIEAAITQSWICPLTDSLRINQLYHINNIISTHEYRPDWRSLKKFGDPDSIKLFIHNNSIKYVIILEDFVGSATQSSKPLQFASTICQNTKILFVPLIICQKGLSKIEADLNPFNNFSISPVMVLSEESFVSKQQLSNEDSFIKDVRKIISTEIPQYKGQKFGFEEMGCLLVMQTNTPNNSLPLIYFDQENDWHPLFKRHHRSNV